MIILAGGSRLDLPSWRVLSYIPVGSLRELSRIPLKAETSVLNECWKQQPPWTLKIVSRRLPPKAVPNFPYPSVLTFVDIWISMLPEVSTKPGNGSTRPKPKATLQLLH